jgi:hypothetical protein
MSTFFSQVSIPTLQDAYDNRESSSTIDILTDTTRDAVKIQLGPSGLGTDNIFDVQTAAGTTIFSVSEDETQANGKGGNSTRLGIGTVASGVGSVAVGSDCSCLGIFSYASGNSAAVPSGVVNTAVGSGVTVTSGSFGMGLGSNVSVSASNGFGVGTSLDVDGPNSYIIGINSSTGTSASSSVVIGNGVDTNFAHTLSLGNRSIPTKANQMVAGGDVAGGGIIEAVFGRGVADQVPNTDFTFKTTAGIGLNVIGTNLNIEPGSSTGNALSGEFIISLAAPGASGSTPNTAVERFRVKCTGESKFSGGIIKPTREESTTITVTINDYYIEVDTSAGDVIVNLPAVVPGQEFVIIKATSDLNKVIVTPNGSDTIDFGETELNILFFKDAAKIAGATNATDWRVA